MKTCRHARLWRKTWTFIILHEHGSWCMYKGKPGTCVVMHAGREKRCMQTEKNDACRQRKTWAWVVIHAERLISSPNDSQIKCVCPNVTSFDQHLLYAQIYDEDVCKLPRDATIYCIEYDVHCTSLSFYTGLFVVTRRHATNTSTSSLYMQCPDATSQTLARTSLYM